MNSANFSPTRRRWDPKIVRLLATLGLLASAAISAASPAGAQVVGNTYTSPNFGCSYSWDGNWFVAEEESKPAIDILRITNGLAYANLFCEANDYGSLGFAVALMSGAWRNNPKISNFTPILDGAGNAIRGEEPGRTFAAFSYTYTFDDGSTRDFGSFFEARVVINSETLMTLIADMPIEHFFSNYQLPGVTLPPTFVQAEAPVAIGEPGPVFADGFWRIAVAAGARGVALPGVELSAKSGKEWIVTLVDVTNWSDAGREFNARDVRLTLAGASKPSRIAPASTINLSGRLGNSELTDDATIQLQPGETKRIALVYSIKVGSTVEQLTIGDASLPLADLLDLQMSADSLPGPAQAPETKAGTLASASDGRTTRVQIAAETDAARIRLLGVEPPAKGACMANAAENVLDDLVGSRVIVEEDGALTGDDNTLRYLWLVNDDGSRTLLNQLLIAEGRATAAPIPGDARFALWLQTSEEQAEADNIGLWAGCEEPSPTATTAAATATPAAAKTTPSPTATATRETTPTPQPAVRWSGEIDDVGTINFTIEDGGLSRLSINYAIACTASGATRSGGGNATFDPPKSIASGSFTAPLGINATDSMQVTGLIMDDTSIVGTVTVPVIAGCTTEEIQARWSASPV